MIILIWLAAVKSLKISDCDGCLRESTKNRICRNGACCGTDCPTDSTCSSGGYFDLGNIWFAFCPGAQEKVLEPDETVRSIKTNVTGHSSFILKPDLGKTIINRKSRIKFKINSSNLDIYGY